MASQGSPRIPNAPAEYSSMSTQQILTIVQLAMDELFRRTNFGDTTTTVGSTGSADALPLNPAGYIRLPIGSTVVLVPYYNET